MEYQVTNCDEVIGSVIRKTRITDTSYISDMPIWIGEAMGLMKTKVSLIQKWEDVCITFHRGKLPCGFNRMSAVEYNGCRLIKINSSKSLDIPTSPSPSQAALGTTNGFISVFIKRETPEDSFIYDTTAVPVCTSLEQAMGLVEGTHWYDTEITGYITTSFKDGVCRVHFKAIPTDEFGLPLIPDNENFKVALYFYIRAQMIGAGYPDTVFTWDKLMAPQVGLFEVYAARAKAEIRYPAVDSMEAKVNAMTRLVKDEEWFDKYFASPHSERFYDGTDFFTTSAIL